MNVNLDKLGDLFTAGMDLNMNSLSHSSEYPCGYHSFPGVTSLKVKKLHPAAKLPTRGTPFAAGLDLYALEDVEMTRNSGKPICIGTGIAVEIPPGYVGEIWGRSSLECKMGLERCAGVIDSDYRGEIKVAIKLPGDVYPFDIPAGDRIAQLLIKPVVLCDVVEVEELSKTERGSGGFGSTGK